ncbi:MAG: DUF932 domain-containing protein [Victivallales bacterium]|nr:DUF932 domain-containing protein [Victivallales bacterium]
MNELMLHCGARPLTLNELSYITTPEATSSWRPVSHYAAANKVVAEARRRGYRIADEQWGVNAVGTKMFGVIRCFPDGHPEYSRAIGVRNSHDKSLALGIVAGARIIVCDNLCFGGEVKLARKHTANIDAEWFISYSFDVLQTSGFAQLEQGIDRLKNTPLSVDQARIMIVASAEAGAIPGCDILPVLREFIAPRHAAFAAPNRWSLYNAFTELAKKYSPARADRCYRKLGEQFGLA